MENNSDKVTAQLNKLLKIEDAPAFGSGKLSVDDDKLFSGLAHPFSLIIWLWKRKESPAVDAHGKEALNMGITWLLAVNLPLYIIMRILPTSLLGILSILLTIASLGMLALLIYGLLQARQGKLVRYPFNFRLIK